MAYIGNTPWVSSQRITSEFTATAGQTIFSPSNGYTLGYLDVYLNGVKLVAGDDYTATNGSTVELLVGANEGDSVETIAYVPRGLSDGYTKTEADGKFLTGNSSINALGDVNTVATAPTSGQVLAWNGSYWAPSTVAGGGGGGVVFSGVSTVNGETGTVVLNTDDISEGSVNLYYTDVRADARIALASIDALVDVDTTTSAPSTGQVLSWNGNKWTPSTVSGGGGAVASVNTKTGTVVLNTDDISEGLTNLYYTTNRWDTRLATKTTDNLTEGSTNLYYTTSRWDTRLAAKTTDNLTEGSTNLYYTNTRADARIAAASINALADVDTATSAPTNGQVLSWNGTNWVPSTVSGGGGSVTSVNSKTGVVVLNSDDVAEGSTNLYYTQTRARAAISVTDSGGDGSLSYNNSTGVFTYTGPSATEVRAHFSASTGITITNGAIATTITQYTDTLARSAISVTDSGGDGSLSYNNSTGVITYTGPSATEVRAHFSAGTGVTLSSGQISIGQAVGTSDNVTFNTVTLSSDPTNSLHAATKSYVDSVAEGIKAKPAVEIATTANLTATYSNGTNGVGATLTSTTNGAFPTIDGITLTSTTPGQNGVLVKNQTNAAENGRYNLTQVGDAGTPWILTRCGLCDQSTEIPGAYVFVKSGTSYAGTGWVQTVTNTATFAVGVDPILVTQFTGGASYSAGSGLSLVGNQFSHADTSSVSDLTSDNSGATFIQDISFTFDTYGHVTAASVATASALTSQSNDFGNIAISTDSGFTWGTANINTTQTADTTSDTLTLVNGSGINLYTSTVSGTDAVKIEHADTSSVADLSATSRTYVTGLTFDTHGHVQTYSTASETVVDTNTTYTVSAETATGGANIRLTGSDSSTDDVKIASGSNITVTRTDSSTVTISGEYTFSYRYSGNLDINAGTEKLYLHKSATCKEISAFVGTAPTGQGLSVTLLKNGGSFATVTISAGATSNTQISQNTQFALGDYITVNITQIGTTNPGADLYIVLTFV